MAFLKYLSEKLEAQAIYDGIKGKYETRFKVNGIEYAFIATAMAGDCDDNAQWMLEFENMTTHRIGIGDDDKKVAKAFGEAVGQWIKERSPVNFYTYGSHFDSIKNIIEEVKKQAKGYTLVDDTANKKDENGEIIDGNPVGKITWTKMIVQEIVPTEPSEDKANVKQSKFDKPYEEPKDIKPNKSYMSGTSNKGKLDNGDKAYDTKIESFSEFKEKKLGVLEEGKRLDALKGAAKAALRRIQEKIKDVFKEFINFSKDELIQWLNDNKENFVQAMDIVKHMIDKKQLTFEEEIISGELLKENILDLVAKKSPKVLTAAALILMVMGSGQRVFSKNDSGNEAFNKAQKNIEKIIEIVKEQGVKAGEKIEKSSEKIGKNIKKSAEKVSKEIGKGAEEVGKGIKAKVKAGIEKVDTEQLKQGFKKLMQQKKEEKQKEEIKQKPTINPRNVA